MPATEPARVPDPGAPRFPVVDPATGEAFDEAPDQQPDELDGVIDQAQRAWSGWRADPPRAPPRCARRPTRWRR